MNAVERALVKGPGFKIVTTGHSLGGALSHFAGVDLRNQGRTVDLVRSLFYSIPPFLR
jgi:thioesterase domain-containing protein